MMMIAMFEQYHLASGCCLGVGRTLVVAFADSHGQSTRLTIILQLTTCHFIIIVVVVIVNIMYVDHCRHHED